MIFDSHLEHEKLNSIKLTESLKILPYKINQSIDLKFQGLNAVIKNGFKFPGILHVKNIFTDLSAKLQIEDSRFINELQKDISINGKAGISAKVKLKSSDKIETNIFLNTSLMDINMKDVLELNNLNTNIKISKNINLSAKKSIVNNSKKLPLSIKIIQGTSVSALHTNNLFIENKAHANYSNPSISFQKINLKKPVPVKIGPSKIHLNLENDLPELDYFHFEALGGSIIGYVNINKTMENFIFNLNISFSGINSEKIFENTTTGTDSEISGSLIIKCPITEKLSVIQKELKINLIFSHIGSSFIERLLYVLDPYESNETIVAQRKYFRMGSPEWIQIKIENGNLSLKGQVQVKGIKINIPGLDGLNISNILKTSGIEENLQQMKCIVEILEKIERLNY